MSRRENVSVGACHGGCCGEERDENMFATLSMVLPYLYRTFSSECCCGYRALDHNKMSSSSSIADTSKVKVELLKSDRGNSGRYSL